MGVRRQPPIAAAMSNSDSSIALCTSVGFRMQDVAQYNAAAETLGPDVFVGAADVPNATMWSQKRAQKMCDRTATWTERLVQARKASSAKFGIFAPLLPIPYEQQRMYWQDLEELRTDLDGLAAYHPAVIPQLPAELEHLPRLSLQQPASLRDLLAQISLGVDLFVLPFIANTSEAGMAFTFRFSESGCLPAGSPAPLAIDLSNTEAHSTSLAPLFEGCECYTCTTHHRAYINHLLNTREMLSWTLLQIHNHHIMDRFFACVRSSIEAGTFESDKAHFLQAFEEELPVATGERPRVRGYQYKSEGPGEQKRNKPQFGKLDGIVDASSRGSLSEAATPISGAGSEDTIDHGLNGTVR